MTNNMNISNLNELKELREKSRQRVRNKLEIDKKQYIEELQQKEKEYHKNKMSLDVKDIYQLFMGIDNEMSEQIKQQLVVSIKYLQNKKDRIKLIDMILKR